MTSSDLRFGIRDCLCVAGLMLVVLALIALLFEFLSRLQLGMWSLTSIATVLDHFHVLPVLSTEGVDGLPKSLKLAMQIVLNFPVSITMFFIGSVIAIIYDHCVYVNHQAIDRAYTISFGFDQVGEDGQPR